MRILLQSNAEWAPTGYGTQTRYLAPGLESLGHTVAIFPFWGLQGGMLEHEGRVNYPTWSNEWGNDVFDRHASHFKADVVITLMDTWVLPDDFGVRVNWLPWVPVDHSPVPPRIVERMRTAKRVIAYSRFGQSEFKNAGISSDYIPHGTNTEVFKPLDIDKRQLKSELGYPPDCFLVGMVAANKGWPCRKCFPESMEAFAELVKRHPDARLYCHSEPTNRYGGPDLQGMSQDYGIQAYTRFPNPYLLQLGFPEETMARVFNAFDVLLAASMGEGFGIPILESQACGVPVITTDFSSMPELTKAGWKVPPSRRFWTPLNAFQVMPSIDGMVDALEQAYQADRKQLGKVGREFALDFSWPKLIQEGWKPLLDRILPISYQHKE